MPKNERADETILQPATPKGNSLRITVPAFVIQQFDLEKGDRLRWKVLNVEEKTIKVMVVDK